MDLGHWIAIIAVAVSVLGGGGLIGWVHSIIRKLLDDLEKERSARQESMSEERGERHKAELRIAALESDRERDRVTMNQLLEHMRACHIEALKVNTLEVKVNGFELTMKELKEVLFSMRRRRPTNLQEPGA